MMALDVKMKKWLWAPNWGWTMALNAKRKMALDIELKASNDSERRDEHVALNANRKIINGSERQTGDATMMALKARTENGWWLWTPNCEEMIRGGEICLSVACRSNPQSAGRAWKRLWVSKDALLSSQNDQVDSEHSLMTHPTKSRGLLECRNKPNSSNS